MRADSGNGPNTDSWESLAQFNNEPEWFKDAKLGIYFTWGPYCVPAYQSEWYPRWMYIKNGEGWSPDVYILEAEEWSRGIADYHEKTYGPASKFNYHDFIPMFRAERYDPADWADLFVRAGARFAGPCVQHHDGFAMWDSKVNPWNAKAMGPKRDLVGDLMEELKKRNLKTIATFHHERNLQRYADKPDQWGGWDSHFPYHPDFATSSTDPKLKYLYGNIPAEEFHDYWLEQIHEVVNSHAPDIIWFDGWLHLIPDDYLRKMVAQQLHAGADRDRENLVVYKKTALPRDVGVLDMEQAGMTEMSPDYWMTDITISFNSWSYVQDQRYKPVDLLLRNMIDVWSKKGIVLLNLCPAAGGIINEEQRNILSEMGGWLEKYGEAVYGTRTHSIFGYGKANIEPGFEGEGQSATIEYSADDIRFTKSKDGKKLYIFLLGMPEAHTKLELKHVCNAPTETIQRVSLLGSKTHIQWSMEGDKLQVSTPDKSEMNAIATVFKVEIDQPL